MCNRIAIDIQYLRVIYQSQCPPNHLQMVSREVWLLLANPIESDLETKVSEQNF